MIDAITVLALILLPALALRVQKKYSWASAIFICYAIGIFIGNTAGDSLNAPLLKNTYEVCVILALPILLFSTDIKAWFQESKKALIAFGGAILSTLMAVVVAFYLLNESTPLAAEMSALITGVYTGGTANMSALHIAIETPESLFVTLNAFDIVLSTSYFLIMISVGQFLLNKFLKPSDKGNSDSFEAESQISFQWYIHWRPILITLLLGIVIFAGSLGISQMIYGEPNGSFIVISVSVLGIVLSSIKRVRELPLTYDSGNYLLLIFALAVGSFADYSSITESSLPTLKFISLVFLIMICIHVIISKITKIDTDLHFISSAAAVFGPPFIGPVAQGLKNKKLIAPGVTIGIIGNAIGTYLGLLIAALLSA